MNIAHSPNNQIELETLLPANMERIFNHWTDPEKVIKWFGSANTQLVSTEVDLRPGGTWRFVTSKNETGQSYLTGEYIQITPHSHLSFTWRHVVETDGKTEATPDSRVTIELSTEGAATRLRLVHDGVQTDGARQNIGSGWGDSFEKLAALIQSA
ncbi:MAG: SRPBCC family protein [Pikeienuella sp.]